MLVIYKTDLSAEIAQLQRALPSLQQMRLDELSTVDDTLVVFSDVETFLNQQWKNPTIVLARAEQGSLLAKAWQKGALAGWIWNELPAQPEEVFKQLDLQYKRNQDSRDLPAAARLQQRMLPRPLEIDGYQIEQFFQPAAFLSGDWFDYWQVDDQQILFYLADVAGHGVTSSLLTSWMAGFHGRAYSPMQLVTKLNNKLVAQNAEKHITLVCGLLDFKTNDIEWCSAGHYPPPILLQPGQEPAILTTSSLPLGLTSDLKIQTQHLHMKSGAQLIFCSDGALESFKGGLNEQFNQLIKTLQTDGLKPPEHVPDDIAILCLSRK
ncbi:PP2C family protein-serine/threonine phosphatase [Alkanindiges illinoisensis]|uniref:PP2C family protein-serine/threonine phosphatase n=1 Tax=Alkanindiges illinoisensis TaxID=197183 RepID=UPI00068583F4|nr:PP2C family protein-serine/threonine phosphatase [Alkanindiges illinoisensis]